MLEIWGLDLPRCSYVLSFLVFLFIPVPNLGRFIHASVFLLPFPSQKKRLA